MEKTETAEATMGDRPKNQDHNKGMGRGYAHRTPTNEGTTKDSQKNIAKFELDTHVEILEFVEKTILAGH